MSQLVRLEGKHTWQNAHCAVVNDHWSLSTLCDCDVDRVLLGARPGHHGIDTPSIKWSSSSWLAIMIRDWFRSKWSPPQLPEQVFLLLNLLLRLCQRSLPLSCSLQLTHLGQYGRYLLYQRRLQLVKNSRIHFNKVIKDWTLPLQQCTIISWVEWWSAYKE